jgi:hypothetical protein
MGGLVMAVRSSVLVIPIITSNFWPERPPIRAYGKALAFMAAGRVGTCSWRTSWWRV